MGPEQVTVLVVDDDFEIRALYAEKLEEAGAFVLTAAGGLDARQLLRSTQPDACILDLGLVDGSGIDLLDSLPDEALVLVVTGQTGNPVLRDVLGRGVDDVLFKPFSFDELVARLFGRLEGRRAEAVSAAAAEEEICPVLRLGVNDLVCVRRSNRVELSPREARALKLLAEADGEPLDRESLCRQVYGEAWDPNSRRVDALISRVRRKLECNRCGAHRGLSTVHNLGYRLVVPIALSED